MSNYKENEIFICAFNERAMRANTIEGLSVMLVVFLFMSVVSGNVWVSLGFLTFYLLFVWWMLYTNKSIVTKSFFEISEDGILKCWVSGKLYKSYPIKEIKSIERTNEEGKTKHHCSYTMVYNSKGRDIIPGDGVMIYFNRKWYKSVMPVFFNPEDIDGFISAIKNRLDDYAIEDSARIEEK